MNLSFSQNGCGFEWQWIISALWVDLWAGWAAVCELKYDVTTGEGKCLSLSQILLLAPTMASTQLALIPQRRSVHY